METKDLRYLLILSLVLAAKLPAAFAADADGTEDDGQTLAELAAAPARPAVTAAAKAKDTVQTSIIEQTERGEHLKALVTYDQVSQGETQVSLADRLSAAKSAWALGLPGRARLAWEQALDDPQFQGAERSRAELARAIMELQERRYDEARSIAERAANDVEIPGIRAQLHLVIAESLREQGVLNLASEYYKKARDVGDKTTANEAGFLLGETQLKLGQFTEARYSFTSIELSSPFAPQAIRRLAEIDLTQKNFEGVLTWIQEGRDNHFAEVDDAWSQYALVSSLSALGRSSSAQAELKTFQARYSEKNSWYLLAAAAVETALIGPAAKADGVRKSGAVQSAN